MATQAEYARAAALIVQLQSDLDAIAAAERGNFQRSRAITRLQDTYVALGRIRLSDRLDQLDTLLERGVTSRRQGEPRREVRMSVIYRALSVSLIVATVAAWAAVWTSFRSAQQQLDRP